MPVLRVAVPTPLHRLFDYLSPPGAEMAVAAPGARVRVPFGNRETTGYLIETCASSTGDVDSLKPATEILDPQPLLPSPLLALCRWAAEYYRHPPGEVYQAAFPVYLRRGEPHRTLADPGWRLTTRGRGLPPGALARAPKQALALSLLQEAAAVSMAQLTAAGIHRATLSALQQKTLAEPCTIDREVPTVKVSAHPELTDEQSAAVAALRAADGGFSCNLLEGVTGSGKTEVYLQLIEDCLAAGRQALVLIPEIGLTPQTLARFRARFDAGIAVLHSGLGEAERYRAWEAARSGAARIVIGTRSAVFTPLCEAGLIVVDEEHDSSFKQQDGFRYNARDVAVKRGQLENCPVLLGSATPSLESLHNALSGRYRHLRLTRRAGGGRLPRLEAVDVRHAPLQAGLSRPLLQAVDEALAAGRQALLFLNRRGYAPTLQCHDCGWTASCSECDARLTLHRRARRLRCHHCGSAVGLPRHCPDCRSDQLLTRGLGTEQTEEFLRKRFGDYPVYRVDSDSMQGRASMQRLVDQVAGGDPCVLLGTQMLTKGHDFPALTLVGIIDMDAMLFSTDFRGEEHGAQLLTQVAGRAGRADAGGRVIVQTHHPDHPGLRAMLQLPYHEQALQMLARREAAGLPPFGYLLLLRTDCADADTGEAFLRDLRTAAEPLLGEGTRLIGPLPAPMQRRAGRFRSQLLAHSLERGASLGAARALVELARQMPARRGLKWSMDVDPLDLF